MLKLLIAVSLAGLATGCGFVPLGTSSDTPAERVEAAAVATGTPTVAIVYRGETILPVEDYFPRGRALVPFSGPKESLDAAYPRERARVAAEKWIAFQAERRPGELLLTVECERHDSVLVAIYDTIFLIPAIFVALPPLFSSFDRELVLTLTDPQGAVVAEGRSRTLTFHVGTFGHIFWQHKHCSPGPDVGEATRGLLHDLTRRR